MKRVTTTMMMAAMAVSIHLSGCGQQGPAPVQAPPAASPAAQTPDFFVLDAAASSTVRMQASESKKQQILAQLGLDEVQKAELKLIRAKVKGLFNKEEMKAKWQSMQALLSAPTIDADAVKAFIASVDADLKAKVDPMVALAGEMRDVLSAEQRDKLVSLLGEEQDDEQATQTLSTFRANTINALNLNTNQQDALTTMQARMEAHHDVKREAKRKAFLQFIMDGNQVALADSLKRSMGHDDVDGAIQWLGTLSQDQRKVLVDRLGELKKKHMAKMTED